VRTENSLLEGNVVSIYAWTTGPGGGLVPLPATLSSALSDYLQTVAIGTDFVQILSGTSNPVPISLLFSTLPGFSIVDTETLVLEAISDIITPLLPGQPVIFSDLVVALAAVLGVDNLVMATPTTDLYTSNPMQLFTVPQDAFVYALTMNSVGSPVVDVNGATVNAYAIQLPVYPLQAWSFTMTLGINNFSVVPYLSQQASGLVQVQQALLLGPNLSLDPAYPSSINLLTGQGTIYVIGAPGNLSFQLITAQGYSAIRSVDLYIGYQGDVSQSNRQQIRAALQAWGQGFGVGSSIYASAINGVSASVASVTAMLLSLPGVTSVNRVALDTPANTQQSVTAADYARTVIGAIILNNQNP